MSTRLCLVVETTTRHHDPWRDVRLNFVEPILRELGSSNTVEYALVLVGAHRLSVTDAACSGWTRDLQELRRWLDSIDFCGGGSASSGLSLASALQGAACLFTQPSTLITPPTCHCLLCLVSDPGPKAIGWPWPEECGKVTGCTSLATSAELCCAFEKHSWHLALASRREKPLVRPSLLWHLLNMISDTPVDYMESTVALMAAARQQPALTRCHVTSRAGCIAFFPHWEAMLRLLQQQQGGRAEAGTDTGRVDAYVAADSAAQARLAVPALTINHFLLDGKDARMIAAAAQRPGAVVMRLVPTEYGPNGEQALRRMADGLVTGQVDLGPGLSGYLSVQVKETDGRQRLVLRLLCLAR